MAVSFLATDVSPAVGAQDWRLSMGRSLLSKGVATDMKSLLKFSSKVLCGPFLCNEL